MKRIAIISSYAGAQVSFRGPLLQALAARDVRVFALAPDYDEEIRAAVRSLGAEPVDYRLSRTGIHPLRDVVDTLRLAVLLRRLRVDLTFSHFIKPVIYGTIAAWLARVPQRVGMIEGLGFVFTDDGRPLGLKRLLLRWIVSRLYRIGARLCQRVIFLNFDDEAEFTARGIVAPGKSVVLGGIGVDLSEWSPPEARLTEPMTFILVARLLRDKGVLDFVEAARRLKHAYPTVRFVLLGGLDENPGGLTRELAESWVREGVVEWPGHVPIRPWLKQASVFVLPSYREGVPRSTQEAMAMGLPVITTDVPGCRDTVIDGRNGFLVPVRNPDALAQAMEFFIADNSLIPRMGSESRALAEERFDVHVVNDRLIGFLGLAERADG